MDVYLEVGSKRSFAGAIEWPGWARSGRDQAAALVALLEYAPRYAEALGQSFDVRPPASVAEFEIVERLKGNATTDFGAPGAIPDADAEHLTGVELDRQIAVLDAAWGALDRAISETARVELRKGPRGGGRDHEGIARHLFEAERSYLSQLGPRHREEAGDDAMAAMPALRSAVREALRNPVPLEAAPGRQPRKLWPPRYFVRRAAWHVLDHTWEIEDRAAAG